MRAIITRALVALIRRTRPAPLTLEEMVARYDAHLDTEWRRLRTERGEEIAERAWRRAVAA